ncbi:MAG: hypothetical protein HC842_00020 [Cytophagales bacterium]|nr:hypothetical protein [Cytophagales bacterium]
MLEYAKMILSKVSFDRKLFVKEFHKARKSLVPEDRVKLERWCRDQFGTKYQLYIHDSVLELD